MGETIMKLSRFILAIGILVFGWFPLKLSAQLDAGSAGRIFNSLELDKTSDSKVIRQYGKSLLDFYEHTGDECHYIRTLLFIKNYQIKDGDYNSALKTLFIARNKAKENTCDQYPLIPEIFASYANLYGSINDEKRSLYYCNLGIQSWRNQFKDYYTLIRLYMNKSGLLKTMQEQLYFANLAYDLAVKSGNVIQQENAMNNIGTIYATEGLIKEAKPYLQKALSMSIKRKAYLMIPSLYNNLAGIASDPREMRMFVDSSLYYAQLSGSLDDQLTAYQNIGLLNYNEGKYKDGYDAIWTSKVLQDSLYNSNRIKSFADMEQKYESQRKNTEIQLLKSANEIATLQASRRLVISITFGFAVLALIIIAYVFYQQNIKKLKLNQALAIEKKKSDDLLLNILPEEIADELKQTGTSKARLYNHVTVLFTDFINFTGISEQLSPTELVQEIHNNFTAFDAIIEKHGLEKIKTIGDAYLAVCGLPHELPDHAIRVTRAAIDIKNHMEKHGGKFKIRIGLHSGPVVAGIVGVKKYAYDIWGDTVNMANRMESNSEAGKINVSGATHELIADHFNCIHRGKIQAKNKGEVDMYFVYET